VGRYGIERFYENILAGKASKMPTTDSLTNIFVNLAQKVFNSPKDGYDIVLTIEPNVQAALEAALQKISEKWEAKGCGGIIIEPYTGKILAMAAVPNFDPNDYKSVSDFSVFVNPLVEHTYEMGSVFKPLTFAAALNENRITPETTYVDQGYVVVNNERIENYDAKARGQINMQRVLNESLNTGAVFVMQQLGKELFADYMKKFGLGEKTGIDLPNEIEGNLSNLSSSREIEFATASFGQGIAVTPIGITMALASLANGGVLMQPYIVERIVMPGIPDQIVKPSVRRRVLTPETSEKITRMLATVVDDALLGGTVKLEHYSIAAKTGTAQVPCKHKKGYCEGEFLHAFFGYAPAFDAKFLIFLYIENPQGVRYASHSLTYPFMELMKFLFNYYEIPPDR